MSTDMPWALVDAAAEGEHGGAAPVDGTDARANVNVAPADADAAPVLEAVLVVDAAVSEEPVTQHARA